MDDSKGAFPAQAVPVDAKVAVEGQGLAEPEAFHQGKARAIDQAEVLVRP